MIEAANQVVIVLRTEPDEHLALRREESGLLLLAHWSTHKPAGTWL